LFFTVDELMVRYELHPELCDIYVEGDSDQGFLSWFFQQKGRHTVSVYPISVVNIPPELVLAHGLEHPSRRSEVITLALELEANCAPDIHVICVADSDFDRIRGGARNCVRLLYTDYTSMEMYAFSADAVDKLIRIAAPRLRITGAESLTHIQGTLQTLFALRLANTELMFGLAWVPFERCTALVQSRIVFDESDYSNRYLNTRGRRNDAQVFTSKLADVRARFLPDVRHQIRGRDFIEVLAWYLKKRARSCRDLNAETLRALLLIQLSVDLLQRDLLFRTLSILTENCA
jgi:hypothetical protein